MTDTEEYVAGLREFADWLEAHPEQAAHFGRGEVSAYPLNDERQPPSVA